MQEYFSLALQNLVFKKYKIINGKKYGPYLYENKRVGDKIITTYLGKANDKKSEKNSFGIYLLIVLILVVGVALFLALQNISPTGKVVLEVEEKYVSGEIISSNAKLILNEGEFLPADSIVEVRLGEQSEKYFLSELMDFEKTQGNFYVEGKNIAGQGEGYGIPGKKTVYPELSFKILVKSEIQQDSSSEVGQEELNVPEENPEETSGMQADFGEQIIETEESNTPVSEESLEISPLTGAAISESENEQEIIGSVSAEEDFIYQLQEGEEAELVSGSVEYNGDILSDNVVSFKIENGGVIVSTQYSIEEEGFGSEFLSEEESDLNFNLNKFNIFANDGTLDLKLTYQDELIAEFQTEINVDETAGSEEPLIDEEPIVPDIEGNLTPELNVSDILNETIVEETISTINLIRNIQTIRMAENETYLIDLNEYFLGAESYEFAGNNIKYIITGSELALTAEEGFKGAIKAKVIAINGSEILESNEFLILVSNGAISITTSRSKIIVGEPVKWSKNVTLAQAEKIVIELPGEASNINVKKVDDVGEKELQLSSILTGSVIRDSEDNSILRFLKKILTALTGRVVSDTTQNDTLQIELNQNATNYVIEYETPAAQAVEEIISRGRIISISAPDEFNYTDVIAHSEIQEKVGYDKLDSIKVLWRNYDSTNVEIKQVAQVEEEQIVEQIVSDVLNISLSENNVSNVLNNTYILQEIPFDAYDLDFDGLIDYIEWVVPHLSNQTFEIIYITKAEHLDENRNFIADVYELVKERDYNYSSIPAEHYLRVTFEKNLSSSRDITFYGKSSGAQIEVYERGGNISLATFENITEDKEYKIYLTQLQVEQDTFDLKIFGNDTYIDYVVDPQFDNANISFVDPTPANATVIANTSFFVNVSISNLTSRLGSIVYNWNGTNYTMYNDSLVLMMGLNNLSSLGENTTRFVDISRYGYNGSCVGTACPLFNTSGKYGGAMQFDGSTDVINVSDIGSTDGATYFTISAWIYQDSLSAGKSIVSKYGGSNGWALATGPANNEINFMVGTSGTYNYGYVAGHQAGVWEYWTWVFDGSQSGNANRLKGYLNGVQQSLSFSAQAIQATTDSNAAKVTIGDDPAGGVKWNGKIDEVQIWNRTFSNQEVYQLYTSNLYKYNSTQWYLLVNQSKNATTGLSDGTYTYYAFASNLSGSSNSTELRTIIISSSSSDTIYPLFSSYWDNNATLIENGIALFNVTLNNTNGTVLLEINNINYTARNVTTSVYNVSVNLSSGTYSYKWHSWGNGTNKNYNSSNIRYYTVNQTPDLDIPSINFTNPTPASGITTSNTSILINVSISELNLDSIIYNWNTANYTYYNDSLVLMMGLNNLSSLGENTTRFVDVSRHRYNGSCVGTACPLFNTSGKYGGAMQFDGSTDVINVSDIDSTDGATYLTVSAWIYQDSFNVNRSVVSKYGGSNGWALATGPANNEITFLAGTSVTYNYGYVAGHATGTWEHWMFVYDGSQSGNANRLKGYLNGVQQSLSFSPQAIQATTDSNAAKVTIGDDPAGGVKWNGKIDEVQIWNRTFSNQEVYQLYTSNLYKYNSTQWILYINQSKNATTGLSDGTYTYYSAVYDYARNYNNTETRTIIIGSPSDTTPSLINFTNPTPTNATTTSDTSILINVSVVESDLGSIIYNWNGTNYTMYNNSLVLMMGLNNLSSLGENGTKFIDVSKYSNNGSCTGNVCPTLNTSGKYGNAYTFDGNNDYINVNDANSLDASNITISAWVRTTSKGYVVAKDPGVGPISIASDADDGEIYTTSFWSNGETADGNSSFGLFSSRPQYLFFRFVLPSSIPSGATINSAQMQLYGLGNYQWTGTDDAILEATNSSDASAPTTGNQRPSNDGGSTATTSQVNWNNIAWSSGNYNFANVTSIIQELVSGYGGLSSNAGIVLWISGVTENHYANVELNEFSGSNVAKLTINYTESGAKSNVPYALAVTQNGKAQVSFIVSNVSYNATSVRNVSDGNWHYITGTYNGSALKIYIDGILEDTNNSYSGRLPHVAGSVRIGADYQSTPANFFNGSIDEVLIYDQAMSASEVNQLYMANFYKYNLTQWYLLVNQSKNATTGLSDGTYTYYASAYDSNNNYNLTETRTIIISSNVIAPNVTALIPVAGKMYPNSSLTIEIAANVSDDILVSAVKANITLPNGTINQITLSNLTYLNKYNNSYNIPYLPGRYNITIIANDSTNNVNSTEKSWFNVGGIEVTNCTNLTIAGQTYVLMNNVYGYNGTCFNITVNNITLNGNGYLIDGDNLGIDYGIYASGRTNLTIENFLNISGFYYGIYLESSSNNTINSNILSNNSADGISLQSSSDNNQIINNTASRNGYYGIFISSSSNNTINSNILNNNSADGISLQSSSNRTLLLNNILQTNNLGEIFDTATGNNNTLIYNNSFGEIKWFGNTNNLTIIGNMTFPGNIIIANNSAYLNTGAFTGNINSAANVTLRGILTNFTNPTILKDGVACGSKCYNFTSLNAGTVIFNVTSWSNYTIGEGNNLLTSCGILSSANTVYTLINNLDNQAGTCFNITANNITLNGNGYYIDGNDAPFVNIGVYVYRGENSTIINFLNITDFYTGIYFLNSSNSKIFNNTLSFNNDVGILLSTNSKNNNLSFNTLNNNNDEGIMLSNSSGNQISNNFFNSNRVGIYLFSSSNNNSILNSVMDGNSNAIFDDSTIGENINNTLIYNNSFGEIKWLGNRNNLTINGTFSFPGNIIIANNSAYLNTSAFTGNINRSANITLRGISTSFIDPKILKDRVVCIDCYNFTSLNAGTVIFNVSSWSNYTIEERSYPQISFVPPTPANQTITSNNTLRVNVSINTPVLNSLIYNWNGTNYTMYNDSLLLMYNFENLSVLGENDTYIVDVSKYSYNGTVYNATWNSSGKFGGAFDFNGNNSYIHVGRNVGFTVQSGAVSIWFKSVTNINTRYIFSHKKNGTSDDRVNLRIGSGTDFNDDFVCGFAENNSAIGSNNNVAGDNLWHYGVITWNSTTAQCYLDSNYLGSHVSNLPWANFSVNIGALTNGINTVSESWRWNGSIDEVMIWNRTLTSDEINQLYMTNLYKFNSTQWYLLVNQSTNSTSGLYGSYNYYSAAYGASNNYNTTETRMVDAGGFVSRCGTLSEAGSYTLESDVYGSTCFIITANNTILNGNGHIIDGDDTGTGISAFDRSNTTIKNFLNITDYSYAINLDTSVNSYIVNNTLSSNDRGINLQFSSTGNLIANNTASYNNYGLLLLESSVNNTVINNIFSNNSVYGIDLNTNSSNNTLTNNTANSNPDGIIIKGTSNTNILTSNIFNSNTRGINLESTSSNIIINSLLLGNNIAILDNTTDNTLIYNNSFGEIKWLGNRNNLTINGTFSFPGNIIIANNSAYLNTSAFTGNINRSANLTFYGISTSFILPVIMKDGSLCNDCYNFTSLNAGTVIFNVSSWSNYTIVDSADSINPQINFTNPTPNNGKLTSDNFVIVNVSIAEPNLKSVIYNWNGTNYTMYDNSTLLMLGFNNLSSLGENATAFTDFSGRSNNGTCSGANCPVFNFSGRYGGAYTFNHSYQNITLNNQIDASANMTYSAWIKLAGVTSNVADGEVVFGKTGTVCYIFNFYLDGNVYVGACSGVEQETWAYNINDYKDIWKHLVLTKNGTTITYYVDGVSQGSKTLSTVSPVKYIGFGQGNSFNGTIDEVQILNRTLTQSEINQLYMTNLYKFNSTQWYLYVNQTKNNTAVLDDGSYTYYAAAYDTGNRFNQTETRSITIDKKNPDINFTAPSETSGNAFTRNNILINVTASDTNLVNITVNLYNSTHGLINTTTTSISPNYVNISGLSAGIYYFNATATDILNNRNSTETRNVSIGGNLTQCFNLLEPGTYILQSNIDNYVGTCFNIQADNVTLNGNGYYIDGDDSGTDYGIYVLSRTNITVKNFLEIRGFYHGVIIQSSYNSTILNNSINNNTNTGVSLTVCSGCNVTLNNLNRNGNTALVSISSTDLPTEISFNQINGSVTGISVSASKGTKLIGNNISYATNSGILIQNSINISIISNNLRQSSIYGINLATSNSTLLLNNTIQEIEYAIYDQANGVNNILIYNNSFGEIKWIGNTNNLTINGTFSFPGNIIIANNSAYLNTGAFTGNINKSANVTLYGLSTSYVTPAIYKDSVLCTDCYNFTSLSAGTVIFNVTSWSNYSIQENVDVTAPNINFTNPTPSNASTKSRYDIYVNVSSNDSSDHYTFVDFDGSLILWQRLNNNSALGENATYFVDESLYSNNGTCSGSSCPSYNSSGKFGGAQMFDGLNDYITLPSYNAMSGGTYSLWVKIVTNNANQGWIDSSSADIFQWSGNLVYFRPPTTGNQQSVSISSWSNNSWHHVAMTWNNTGFSGYLDGVHAITGSNADSLSGSIYLGRVDGANYFNGSIDDMLIFNRSLKAQEVAALYNASANQYYNNFTSLSVGMHNFKSYAIDTAGNKNSTETRYVNTANTIPNTPTLIAPANMSSITNRTPTFNWTGSDNDGDTLQFELNITCYASNGSICSTKGNDDRYYNSAIIGMEDNYTLTSDLVYLADYGYYYNWSVRAYDGLNYSVWASSFRFNLDSLISISMPINNINFGSIDLFESKNTTTNSPPPFVIQNDGNAFVNITATATNLWASIFNPNRYFKFKADNNSASAPYENNSFSWANSVTSFTNMTNSTLSQLVINALNYSDASDTVEIDFYVELPPGESAGTRSSIITFMATLEESG